MGEADEQEQNERNRGEQRVERQGTGEKRNIVFVGRLEGAADKTGG
jgi:transposase-like protein